MKSFAEINRAVNEFVISLDRTASYSLERIKGLMNELGNPQDSFKSVHIAGTSGKTSTAYYTAAILQEAGYKVGLSVSPYVEEMNERVQVGTTPLPEAVFCKEFTEFFKILTRLSIKPTYFELFVAFAYWYFAKIKVDYTVIEVGLGGLLDGTNVMVRPDKVCIITDIGFDHTEVLGKSVAEIARQKAGIIKDHNAVFMYHQSEAVESEVIKQAKLKHASLFLLKTPKTEGFSARNWNIAKVACEYIFLRDNHKGLTKTQLQKTTQILIPGRFEVIKQKGKVVILDGAHNLQKIRSLKKNIAAKYPNQSVAVLVAVGENKSKQLKDMAAELDRLDGFVIVTVFDEDEQAEKSSINPKKVAEYFGTEKTIVEPDTEKAYKLLLNRKEQVLLVTGSLYLVGAIKRLLKNS